MITGTTVTFTSDMLTPEDFFGTETSHREEQLRTYGDLSSLHCPLWGLVLEAEKQRCPPWGLGPEAEKQYCPPWDLGSEVEQQPWDLGSEVE